MDRFQEIVNVIGGDGERARAKELLARLTVVPGQDFFKVCLICRKGRCNKQRSVIYEISF